MKIKDLVKKLKIFYLLLARRKKSNRNFFIYYQTIRYIFGSKFFDFKKVVVKNYFILGMD